MNPLPSLTYYIRHKRQTMLLVSLISLMTFGICVMVRLLDSVPENMFTAGSYLTRFSLVSAVGPSLDPGVVSQIRTHPDVSQVIREKGLDITLPPLLANYHLFGVTEGDLTLLMDASDLRLKAGRIPRPRSNEMVLSEEMADAIGIQIGDQIDRSVGQDWTGDSWYEAIPAPLELVGILEGTGSETHIRVGFVSYEYVTNHELFEPPWTSGLVVIAQDSRKAEVDNYLETEIASSSTEVMTHRILAKNTAETSAGFYAILAVIDLLVAIVMALVIGVINQIAQEKRLEEFGLLNTLGRTSGQIVRRLMLETVGVTGIGWLGGLILSWLFFVVLKTILYEPRGMVLDLVDLTPIWFSVPVALATTVFVAFSTLRIFARFDAVAIIERGKLSLEASSNRSAVKRSLIQPLSSWTFYLRHRRRGLILVVAIGLMILGVSFPAFLFSPIGDAMQPLAEPMRQIGIIKPRMNGSVDPGLAAQVRAHSTVSNVIPAVDLPLQVEIPPLNWPISIYGVSEDNMQQLISLYKVEVKEGRLPRPHTNEMIVSEAVAMNRDLGAGDRVGQPVNEEDSGIPTEMVITGILSGLSGGRGEDNLWLGFASYEYLSSHELYASYPVNLLVVPVEGHKAEMDAWLRDEVHSDLAEVLTYKWMQNNYRVLMLIPLAVFGVVEFIIAVVAAVALAVLSYTFFAQRQEEFGTLHALGRSRSWLVLRTIRETASIVAIAWLISALLCGIFLAFVQISLYSPNGLSLNFFSPIPWLFTLPLPLTVVLVSAGLVAWTLRRLDAVSIIERR